MNKVISKVRVTEVDGLSDALVRLYKADEGVSSDVFLKSVMDEIEKLSVSITTAIKKDKVLSNLEEADGALDGVKEILEQIRSAQDSFVKASDEYNAASTVKTESASSLKKPLLSAINDKLIPYITAMQMANSAVYADFATKAEGEIKRVNEIVLRRGK